MGIDRVHILRRQRALLDRLVRLLEAYTELKASDVSLVQKAEKPRIAVVSAEPVLAEGLRAVVSARNLHLLAVCPSVPALMDALQSAQRPDVLILHAMSPDILGEIGALRAQLPQCAITLLVGRVTLELASQAVGAGVRGILRLNASPQMMLEYIEAVARGEMRLNVPPQPPQLIHLYARLTKGQRKLLELVSQGLKNKEIATILNSTEGTVKAGLNRLFRRVGVKDRLELAVYGLQKTAGIQDYGPVRIAWADPSPGPSLIQDKPKTIGASN